jgi:hypothetical protein
LGYCNKHYQKYKKLGDPLANLPRRPTSKWLKEHYRYDGDECLIWPFSLLPNGYGQCANYFGVGKGAHRNMCYMVHGKPPTPKHEAAHSCKQNRACVHPKHLSWKTAKENRKDKVRHNTHRRGERCHLTKLTEAQVKQIRKLQGQYTMYVLAERFGVSYGAINNIMLRRSWAWLA